MSTDPSEAWKHWHEHRVASVSAPYGPLALTGTLPGAERPGAPPGSRTIRRGDFRTSRGSGRPTGTGSSSPSSRKTGRPWTDRPSTGRSGSRPIRGRRAVRGWRTGSVGWSCWCVRGRGACAISPPPPRRTGRSGASRPCRSTRAGRCRGAATSGDSSYRFWFPRPAAPVADGRTTAVRRSTSTASCCRRAPSPITSSAPFPPPGNTLGVVIAAGSASCAEKGADRGRSGQLAQIVQILTAERRPCVYRSFGRILPLSACQGHGVFGIRRRSAN